MVEIKARERGGLNTRVVLLKRRRGVPVVPVDALRVEGIDVALARPRAQLVGALEKSDAKAPGYVPGDVAVPELRKKRSQSLESQVPASNTHTQGGSKRRVEKGVRWGAMT